MEAMMRAPLLITCSLLAIATSSATAAPCGTPCPGVVTLTPPDDSDLIDLETDDDVAAPTVRHAPTMARVLAAAYAAASLARDPARGWRRRARLAGLVP